MDTAYPADFALAKRILDEELGGEAQARRRAPVLGEETVGVRRQKSPSATWKTVRPSERHIRTTCIRSSKTPTTR